MLGISVDSRWSHIAFRQARKIRFHLLSDFEPKGYVAKQYGAYREDVGTCERALFLVDDDGNIQWSYLSQDQVSPGVDGVLDALDMLDETKRQEQAS